MYSISNANKMLITRATQEKEKSDVLKVSMTKFFEVLCRTVDYIVIVKKLQFSTSLGNEL